MDNQQSIVYIGTVYFSDGRPAPLVLTEEETTKLLRLENGPRKSKFTLQNYRQKGVLRGTQIGKKVRYSLEEIIMFLKRQTDESNKEKA